MSANNCSQGHVNSSGMKFCTTCGESLQETIENNSLASAEVVSRTGLEICLSCGRPFEQGKHVCQSCNGLKPLAPGFEIDPSLFQWALDGQAMAKLRSIGPLVALARSVSQRVGRPWIESTFNGIRLGYNQMPHIYSMAVQAGRMLGLKRMPSIYVSGERPWSALTFGSDNDAFIVIGSALVSCFQKGELMFLFAREMGHILAGHALWKTVIQILVGEQNTGAGMMRHGIAGLLDPSRLIEGAIELPLIGWARQAEITADRAGLLASGGLSQARRVLMMWALKSPNLFKSINLKAWIEQQEQDSADNGIRLAELVTASTPYLSRRLKLMQEYDASPLVGQFRSAVISSLAQSRPAEAAKSNGKTNESLKQTASNRIVVSCPGCKKQISVERHFVSDSKPVGVKCPSQDCGQTILIRRREATNEKISHPKFDENLINT
ncbi:MAG: M48 family metalloprotease [Pirellulaceae bacterium]